MMTNDSKDQGREAFDKWYESEKLQYWLMCADKEMCFGIWQAALATSASALARDEASVESHVVFITDRSKSIDEVLPQDRRWVISHAIGLAAAYRNCDAGKTKEVMQEFVDYLRAALEDATTSQATTAEPSKHDPFRAAVESMVAMLEDGEWAEHVAESKAPGDALASRLESAITDLHNSIHALSSDHSASDAASSAATVSDAASVPEQQEVFGYLEAELEAIPCRYHGSPSYDHDAYWMKEKVMKLLAEARKVFAATAAGAQDGRAGCELCNGVGKIGIPGQRCFACDGSGKSFADRAASSATAPLTSDSVERALDRVLKQSKNPLFRSGAKICAAEILSPTKQCTKAPEGWSCSRVEGHEGPCAASQSTNGE